MDDLDRKIDLILCEIEALCEEAGEEDAYVASCVIRCALDCGCNNHYERIGMLQGTLMDIHKEFSDEFDNKMRVKDTHVN